MKSRMSLIAGALFALALAGCGQEEPPSPDPQTKFGNEGAAVTPPGAASGATGNKADENVRDDVPTQDQLDPVPEENKPGGTLDKPAP